MSEWPIKTDHQKDTQSEVYSFQDYMEIFEKSPEQHCRPTFLYLYDMIQHFGQDHKKNYKLFTQTSSDAPAVFGQTKTQNSIAQNLLNFQEEGFNNKFILLVGPNGSSKSSIVRKIMKGAEEYSKKDEGALYTFSWVFPIDNFVKGSLGLGPMNQSQDLQSYAYLEDKDITAIITSDLKDHPLLLIPLDVRQEILEKHLAGDPKKLESIKKSYLYRGDLSKRNRMIYDAILKSHKGDHSSVLKHIRIERFTISKRYSTSAVTIEPQIHVDARMQQITMDKRLASLPPSLQSLNLFSMQGEVVSSNRGILEYSDLLKRPLDTFKYLLQTMETGNINLQGILTELDIFFIGTSNEIHLAAFKQHPDFNSFRGRFNFIHVPYLLDYKEEEKIYENQINSLKSNNSIYEPHALTALCLFSVMTRLRFPQTKNYENKKLANIATNLSPLEKVYLYAGSHLSEKLDMESQQLLKNQRHLIESEFEFENLYEGKFGMSPRDMKNVIYKISSQHKNVTFLEVVEYLQVLINQKSEYDFLNMASQGDYHNPVRSIALIREVMLNQFDRELRDSLGIVDELSYEEYICRYIENINAVIKNEKVKNTITGKFEEVDQFFIQEFEKSINMKENADHFRSQLISKMGAYFLDHPNEKIEYKVIFPDLVDLLKESFRVEQQKVLKIVSKNLLIFEAELDSSEKEKSKISLSEENRELISKVMKNLTEKYHYSFDGAISLLKCILKERY